MIQQYSTRNDGDMRKTETRARFLHVSGVSSSDLVLAQQVHGNAIGVVTKSDCRHLVPSVDGLVTNDADVALGVRTADCVPILLADPVHHILGAVHAGWKGTLGAIAENAVGAMEKLGARAQDIVVSIGPHIGLCCYDVDTRRATLFRTKFGQNNAGIVKTDGAWRLDLGAINRMSLRKAGILSHHIQISAVCTSCQNKDYFSFRKDSKATYGVMMGVVAWK